MSMFEQTIKILQHLHLRDFSPLPTIRGGHAQTIAGVYWPQPADGRDYKRHEVKLPDGDRLVVAENRPKEWQEGQRCVVLVHGLTGHYQSNYMTRLSQRLTKEDVLTIRVNLRGCGPGFGLAKNPYHCGISDDTRAVLRWLKERYPGSPVTQIGFSLGGNITLKMVGEDGNYPTGNLDSVIAVSPPVDLASAAEMLKRKENRFFDRYFTQRALREVDRLHAHFQWPRFKFPKDLNIAKFDEVYTAPVCGFKSAAEYYEKCSSNRFIADIKVPTLIVGSVDDPVVAGSTLAKLPHNLNVELVRTRFGGHVGFLGFGGPSWRWSDDVVMHWLKRNILGRDLMSQPA